MLEKAVTVGEYLLAQLKRLGINRVYGIPGDFIIKFFKLLEDDSGITLCTFSHEQGVGFAAVADARASRKPAVAVVTYGPGILNTLNAVACAYAERTPLIVVAGGPPLGIRSNAFFMHHTVKSCSSLLNAVSEMTAKAVILDDAASAADKIAQAMAACQEYMLPVYIELPADVVNQKIGETTKSAAVLPVDEANVKQAADLIMKKILAAQKPVVLAGIESDRFNLKEEILTFAEEFNLPVVSTVLARDHAPPENSNFFGVYLGVAGSKAANALVTDSDMLLILGEMLSDVNLGAKLAATKKGKIVLCFAREVNAVDQTIVDVPLHNLILELKKAVADRRGLPLPQKAPLQFNRICKRAAAPLIMAEVIDAVNWLFSEFGEMPVIADTGDCLFATLNIQTSTVMAPSFYGTMGFAVPAAIGYALSTKKRPLVLLGDGSFQMTGQEICHCPRYGINPIFVVINNKRWGMEQLFYPSARFNELVDWPYAQMADMWSGKGYRVESCVQLYDALQDAQAQKSFTLIEVVTERDELSKELMAWIVEQKGEEKS